MFLSHCLRDGLSDSETSLLDLRAGSMDRPQGHSFVGHKFLIWGLLVIRGFINIYPACSDSL